jgi:hypothetical protein
MTNFETGATYKMRFITDADATNAIKIIKRTAKTVTIIDLHNGSEKRCKINNNADGEFIFPLGQYSMAPVLRASKKL